MPVVDMDLWRNVVAKILHATRPQREVSAWRTYYDLRWKSASGRLVDAGLADGWTAAVNGEANAIFQTRMPVGTEFVTPTYGYQRRALRMGHAVASEDYRSLSSEEMIFLKGIGLVGTDVPAVEKPGHAATRTDGGTYRVDAVVPWAQLPKGSRSRAAFVHSPTTVIVETVGSERCPVAWSLLAGDDSGWLDVREFEGELYRPILVPETWRPITVDEFARAASGAVAWHDNPFLLSSQYETCAVAPLEYSDPAVPDGMAEEVVDTALERVGRLLSIDGIVHRRTSEPVLRIGLRPQDPNARKDVVMVGFPGWDLGDLSSVTPQETMSGVEAETYAWPWNKFYVNAAFGEAVNVIGPHVVTDPTGRKRDFVPAIVAKAFRRPSEDAVEALEASRGRCHEDTIGEIMTQIAHLYTDAIDDGFEAALERARAGDYDVTEPDDGPALASMGF